MGLNLTIFIVTHPWPWPYFKDQFVRQWTGPVLVQVMACRLMAPTHYLNQCWLLINEVLWHSPEKYFQRVPKLVFCTMSVKITLLKLLPHLSEDNELNAFEPVCFKWYHKKKIHSTLKKLVLVLQFWWVWNHICWPHNKIIQTPRQSHSKKTTTKNHIISVIILINSLRSSDAYMRQ